MKGDSSDLNSPNFFESCRASNSSSRTTFGLMRTALLFEQYEERGLLVWKCSENQREDTSVYLMTIWVFPKIGVPQNGWFITENPIKIHDLGGPPLFLETHICILDSTSTFQPGHRCQCTHTGNSLWVIPDVFSQVHFFFDMFRLVSTRIDFKKHLFRSFRRLMDSDNLHGYRTSTHQTRTVSIESHHFFPSTACPCDR